MVITRDFLVMCLTLSPQHSLISRTLRRTPRRGQRGCPATIEASQHRRSCHSDREATWNGILEKVAQILEPHLGESGAKHDADKRHGAHRARFNQAPPFKNHLVSFNYCHLCHLYCKEVSNHSRHHLSKCVKKCNEQSKFGPSLGRENFAGV